MKYKVYEAELKETASGKALKKLVLQGEKSQYPEKNITMWSDHPLFEDIAPGQTIDVELDVQTSDVPNPHGGFYKNKTVKKDNIPQTKVPATAPQSEIKNYLEFMVVPLLEKIYKEVVIKNERDTFEPDQSDPNDETMSKNNPFEESAF